MNKWRETYHNSKNKIKVNQEKTNGANKNEVEKIAPQKKKEKIRPRKKGRKQTY